MKVKFTPTARRQFLEVLAYIRADSQSAAFTFGDKAESSLLRLRDFPESGRTLPEFSDIAFREVIVTPYRFFYRVKEQTVWIVAVLHSAQLPNEPQDVAGG